MSNVQTVKYLYNEHEKPQLIKKSIWNLYLGPMMSYIHFKIRVWHSCSSGLPKDVSL